MTAHREHRSGRRAAVAYLLAGTLALTACGSDDDGGTSTNLDESGESSSASESGSGSGSASASASGISQDDLAQTTDNELITAAVDGYRDYVAEQIEMMQSETGVMTQAIRDGDLEAAKAAYPISRRPWERIEPIAGLIEDIDGAVDAREDDFDGPEDEDFTGWHKIEWYLWVQEDTEGAVPFADQLEADLDGFAAALPGLELPPGVLTVGAQELIEEVAAPDGKLSGEEDRYSGTDLYDFKANVEGSEELVNLLRPALEEADADLLATIDGQFAKLNEHLAALGSFETGYVNYNDVTEDQKTEFAATLSELAESLSLLNGTLGLE